MPTEDTLASAEHDPTAVLLRLLCDHLTPCVSMIGLRSGDDLLVEIATRSGMVGKTLRMPPVAVVEHSGGIIDVSSLRLSLGWTQLCGWRPDYVAVEPIPERDECLLVTGIGKQPGREGLRQFAAAIEPVLSKADGSRQARKSSSIAALIDNLPLPIVFVDSRTIEVFLNGGARRLLGIESAIATEFDIVEAFARLLRSTDASVAARLSTDPTASLDLEIIENGRAYAVESRWIADNRLLGRLWMFRDVHEERQIARFKDELVSTVSHELRTPLTSINGAIALLNNSVGQGLPPAAATLLDIALRNGNRLALLVNDLLDIDKLQNDKLEIRLQRVNIADLLTEAVAQSAPYAHSYRVSLRLDIDDPAIVAPVDPDRMLQVMANLLSNAVRFSPSGSKVVIGLRRLMHGLRISVADAGPGISPEFRERMYERFSQEGSGTAKGGTGLGLAITKGIVEQHDGTIALDDTVAVGSTFNIDLPVHD
ncbi:sensor histidine kinase [Sphingomonas sp. RS2018]